MAADARRVGNEVLGTKCWSTFAYTRWEAVMVWWSLVPEAPCWERSLGRAQSGRRLLGLMSKATPQVETAEGGWSGAKEKEWPVSATPDSMVKVAPW